MVFYGAYNVMVLRSTNSAVAVVVLCVYDKWRPVMAKRNRETFRRYTRYTPPSNTPYTTKFPGRSNKLLLLLLLRLLLLLLCVYRFPSRRKYKMRALAFRYIEITLWLLVIIIDYIEYDQGVI